MDICLEQFFNRIIEDPRTNLRATFSEEYTDRAPDWDSKRGSLDLDFHDTLRNLLEDANLLHYASSIGDIITVNKLLDRDPDLIHSQCSTVAGKNLLYKYNQYGMLQCTIGKNH